MDKFTVSSLMEVVKEFFPQNTSIAISDSNQYIYYKPSKVVDLHIKPGDPIKEGSGTFKALTEQNKVSQYIDSEIFGIPYYAISVPIFGDDRPLGAITTIFPAKPTPISTNFLTIKRGDLWYPVTYEKVIYMEAENRKTKVQTLEEGGYHKLNLSELEFLLPDDYFIRVHRSYIVNVNYIKEIHPDSHSTFLLIMKGGEKIPVSQTYSSLFRKALNY